MSGLAGQLKPCGPVLDAELAARTREPVEAAAREGGWLKALDTAWPALEPVFAAAPYLAGLARRGPGRLRAILETTPDDRLAAIVEQTDALTGGADDLRAPLRGLKADLHLLTALCDLGGAWDLDRVTGALTAFADAATRAALRAVAHDARQRGKRAQARFKQRFHLGPDLAGQHRDQPPLLTVLEAGEQGTRPVVVDGQRAAAVETERSRQRGRRSEHDPTVGSACDRSPGPRSTRSRC